MDLRELLVNKRTIAISNYKITPETECFASQYDCIIRFNIGSNPIILKKYPFYNGRTSISVLSGWHSGYFGPLEGFEDQTVLFSRPKCVNNILYYYKHICVKKEFEDAFKNTKTLNYIPLYVFYDFYNEYAYDHPTTGLITLYYIYKILHLNIDCLNFFVDNKLYNTFSDIHPSVCYHNLELEKNILDNLNIKQYLI